MSYDIEFYLEGDRLFHTCFRGRKQICPKFETVERWGYYEDGYFRGMRKGRFSKFLNRLAETNFIKCKACGEEFTW